MVDVSPGLTDQKVNVPTDYQSLAQQAFKTQVDPLRESFQENLTGTLESLSKRGIAFGEVGSENIKDVLEEQGKREAEVATKIGTSFGLTQLEQAFQSSEAAKTRSLQKELATSGFEFQAGEAEKGREFAAGEAGLGREQQLTLQETAQGFQAGQTELQRSFESGNLQSRQTFEERMRRVDQEFQGDEAAAQRTFIAEQGELEQSFQQTMQQERITASEGTLEQQLSFQEKMTRVDQEFRGNQAAAQKAFVSEEALLDRTLTTQESQLMRDYQKGLAVGTIDGQKTLEAQQIDFQRQAAITENALNLALEGNLDKETAQSLLEELSGQPMSLTTNDELAVQRISAASGLSPEEYTKMRQALGQGQLNYMLAKDEEGNFTHLDEFIESPEKQRKFELQLADVQNKAQVEIAKIQAEGQVEMAEAENEDRGIIETISFGLLPSCNLATNAYANGNISAKQLMIFPMYRVKVQSKEMFSDMIWSGYIVLSETLMNMFTNSKRTLNFLTNVITKEMFAYMRAKVIKQRPKLKPLMVAMIIKVVSFVSYFIYKKKCDYILREYKGKNLLSLYKKIIRQKEGSANAN